MHGTTKTITDEAMRRLITYDWPGNVRELENAIARSIALGSGPTVEMSDLPSNLHYGTSERVPDHNEILPLEELERRAIFEDPARDFQRQTGRGAHVGNRKDHLVPEIKAILRAARRELKSTWNASNPLPYLYIFLFPLVSIRFALH
jgi:DNA-binding NtrC family response regulator